MGLNLCPSNVSEAVKKHRILLLLFAGLMIQCTHASSISAQWVKLKDFGKAVVSIYFIDLPGPPRIGFVSTVGSDDVGEVWRTTDGGKTWTQCQLSLPTQIIHQFTFKDSVIGWFASWLGYVYKTTDGGLTWTRLSLTQASFNGIHYHAATKLLFVTGENGQVDYVSNDEGTTWSNYSWGNPKGGSMTGYGSMVFNDAMSGIVASTHDHDPYYYTTDGGLNWNTSTIQDVGGFQPTGIPGTKTYLTLDWGLNCIDRSDDGGINWKPGPLLPSPHNLVLEGGVPMLSFQSNTKDGIFVSLDTGRTFTQVCGPSAVNEIRSYVKGYTIYASDADAYYTAKTSLLWMNILDPLHLGGPRPQLAQDTIRMTTVPCGTLDTVVRYSMVSNCFARLTKAVLTGSKFIQLKSSPTLPHDIGVSDSLVLSYTPNGLSNDTTLLKLTFSNSTETFDTTVVVIAQAIGGITSLGIFLPAFSGSPGDTVSITPGIVVSPILDVTLPFSYTVTFDYSLLAPFVPTGNVQAGRRTITIFDTLFHGRPRSNAIQFIVGLGNQDSTSVQPGQLAIGSGCGVQSSFGIGVFHLLNICRAGGVRLFDPSVAVSLSSARPNPASSITTIALQFAEAGYSTLKVFDAIGREVATLFDGDAKPGNATIPFDVSALPPGTYIYRMKTPSQVFSRKLIVRR